jgi:hypothetical protein
MRCSRAHVAQARNSDVHTVMGCARVRRRYNRDMRQCWLVLAVALYLSLDVANPLMPGAVTFGIASSVELRQAKRFRGHSDVVAPIESFDDIGHIAADVVLRPRRPRELAPTVSPAVRRARSALFAASAAAEDPLMRRS